MSISFTGIHNLRLSSEKHEQIGSYYTPDGDIGSGMKDVTYVDISYDVSDDKSGKDHDKYIEALSNANKFSLINSQKPYNVHIHMKLDEIDNDVIEFKNVQFKLNNQPIAFNHDNDYKLFQYLADMTRDRLKKADGITENDKKMLKAVNDGITQAAMDYFECN